jgi:hypothetical protein
MLKSKLLTLAIAGGTFAVSTIAFAEAPARSTPVSTSPARPVVESPVVVVDDGSNHAVSTLRSGMWSLQFNFPTGLNLLVPGGHATGAGAQGSTTGLGGGAGAWYMITNELNVGLNFLVDTAPGTGNDVDVAIAPAARYFFLKHGNVGVFGMTQLAMKITKAVDTDVQIDLFAGAGAEYFLMKQLSLGGQVGFGFEFNRPAGESVSFSSLQSNLNLNIYF